ncbi:helicase DnaB [Brevibacillus agri]|uniref:Helicase DnaB n=1 Tax=Brevibacillus agri TaxID=51101 RepID=A0A3M8ALX0_9BACL|nr:MULTISPECIES: DnaD domain protein [Brevibacillus]QAV15178.1 transposase [Brevibacillus agri]QHZ57841.1 transposase [Brevibacillus sp. NSP2.1]RNB52029.1 transposase [Brevibacillus agri]GED28081.1 helicase DnaB [Brevibacillus agri]
MRRLVWNELLPKDRYLVRLARPLSFSEMGFVTQLYLPIIGVESYALYQMLVHSVQEASGASAEGTHRSLMLASSLSLDRLLDARERLEAIGLVEVRRRENQQRDYYYEYLLKPPLAPGEFFADYVLSLMLLNKIENVRYSQLRQQYADALGSKLAEEYSQVENITKDFHEVFQSLKPSELEVKKGSERERFLTEMETNFPQAEMKSGFEAQVNHSLSVSSLRLYLPDNADAAKVLEGKSMELLFSLCHFYQLDSWGMGQELRDWTLYKADRSLDGEVLRKRLMQRYTEGKLYRSDAALATPDDDWGPGKLPEPGSEAFVRACRLLSPLALLEKVVGGRVSKVYLERAETLVFADGMSPEVVNALLLHTLASMQMELPKAYMETIRDSWKAKRIATVDEAVKQIVERSEQRAQSGEKAKTAKKEQTPVRRNGRAILQDKLPASVEWQLSQEKAAPDASKGQSIQDFPELQKRLETLRKRK